MKRRITALLLSVLMVFSVLPASAFPVFAAPTALADTEVMQNSNQGDGIILAKFARPHLGPDGKPDGTVDIVLQSYTTGQVVQTTTTTPTDIVLVLDLSGSMEDPQSSTTVTTYVEDYATERSYNGPFMSYYYCGLNTNSARYVKLDNGTYVRATRASNDGNGHEIWRYNDGSGNVSVYPALEGNAAPQEAREFNYPVVQLYEQTTQTVAGQKKIDLLHTAVDEFITNTAELNKSVTDATKRHRIAIVKFGTAAYYDESNLLAEGNHKNNRDYNYSEVVKNFTVVDDTVVNGVKNVDALTNAIDSLTPGGATAVDYGMNLANRLFDAQDESTMQGRNKVVVVLTDGSPTHSSSYESAVAGSAINYAKTLKDEGVTVYTISVEEGADATQLGSSNSNRFMHYLSSNYPSASYSSGSIAAGDGNVSAGYYMTTDGTHSLSMIFQQINESIGAPKIELGEEALLVDEVSEFFTVNDDINAVKVYTVDRLPGNKWDTEKPSGLTPVVSGSTVYVSGFDYNANYVSTEPRTVGGADFYGRMLMLVINVTPDYAKIDTHAAEIAANGGKVLTNNATADVMSGTTIIAEVESPTIALNKVTYKVDGADYATYYRLAGGEQTLIAQPTKVGHTFSGWSSTDVTIDNGKFEMIGSDVTIVGTFTANTHSVSYEYVGLEVDGRPQLPAKQENVAYDTTVTVAPTPTLQGYDFVGWYGRDAALGTGNITSFSMPDHDVVLLGRFVPATGVAYKVEHYTETFKDGEFELKEYENLTGTTGETATAAAKNYEGFTFDNTVTGTKVSGEILADGSLTLKLYYTRNSYDVTYEYVGTTVPDDADPAGVIGTPIASYTETHKYKYGETVNVKADATANGYVFTGWYSTGGTVTPDTASFTMPDHAVTLRGYFSARTDVVYKVEHYFENANDTNYTKDDTLTETFTNGTMGATVTAAPLNVQGFTFDGGVTGTVQSGTVTADDPDTAVDETLVLKLYYKRNAYPVTYGYEGVLPTTFAPSEAELANYTEYVKWGADVTVKPDASADRYDFHGWYRDGDPSHTKVTSFEMPMHAVELLGHFEKLEDPSYTVKHFFEDANGNYVEDTSYEETLKAPEGESVRANPLKVDGYKFNPTETGTKNTGVVVDDNSLTLEVYYERESYTVTYLYDNTVPGASDLSKAPYETKSYKWGKNVDVAADATAPGYTFIGWYRNNDAQKAEITSFTMPMHNVELVGMFTANTNTAYKVEHYFETVDGTDYVIDDTKTQNLTGTTGIEVTATPIAVDGFTYNAAASETTRSGVIAGDGSTTLKLYYDRNDYTVDYVYTVAPAGVTPPAAHTEPYGKDGVTVKNAADIAGYTFNGWTPSVQLDISGGTLLGGGTFKMPSSNVTFIGSYRANDYNYRVEHYIETDNGYVLHGTGETRVGKMDTFVSAAAIIINGYTYDADVTVLENANNGIAIGSGEAIDFTNSDRTTLHAKIVDGTLVLAFYYTRNEHKVTYVIEGAIVPEGVTAPAEVTVPFGTVVDVHGGYTEAGYEFSGWTTTDVTVSGGKFDMPNNDVVFTGSFTALEVGYTIKYWHEVLDGENYEKEYRGKKYNEVTADRVTGLTAITGHYVSAYPEYLNEYEGFSADPRQTEYHGYVKGDGSLVLNVYYDRLTYDVTYIYVGYLPDDAPAIPASYNKTGVKFGTPLDVEAKMADYDDRKFDGWHSADVDITTATSFTMPAKNITIYGTYVPAVDYTVTYFVDGKQYEQFTVKPGVVHDIIDTPTGITEFIGWSDPYNVEEGVHFDTTDNDFIMPWSNVEIRGEFKTITPIIHKGELQITKELNAPTGFEKDEFSFGIYEVAGDVNTLVKNVTVKAGQTAYITLAIGKYLVVENDANVDGYTLETTVSDDDATVTIKKGDVVELTFTNTYTEVALEKDDHFGYIIGYPDGMVRPDALITRAEVVTIFFRMLTDASRNHYWATTNSFSDVADTAWYNTAISTLANAGVLDGYGDGTFHPNATITRAELIKIATSFYNTNAGANSEFSDIKDHWAEDFIEEAYALGFVEGYGDGTFQPDAPVTRAETMKIVNRTLERAPHKDHLYDTMTVWPDNMDTSKWYYAEVQEATNSHDYEWITEDGKACESWTAIFPIRDWAALELAWKQEHDGE